MPSHQPPSVEHTPAVHRARWAELDPMTLHELIRLRVEVFVVEQHCPYPELDGRDPDPSTEHLWVDDGGGPLCYLRVLREPDGSRRVGRVCTRQRARGKGLAALLLAEVLRRHGGVPLVLDAQATVTGLYAARGFVPSGPPFVEDGIAHLPMRRDPGPIGAGAAQASAETSSDSGTRGPV